MSGSGSSILIRLRLIGAASANKDLQSVTVSLDEVSVAGKGAGDGLGALGAGGDVATSALDRVKVASVEARDGLVAVRDMGVEAGGMIGHAFSAFGAIAGIGGAFELAKLEKETMDYQELIARIGANTHATQGQLRAMERVGMKVGNQLGVSGKEAAEGFYEMSKTGFTAQEMIKAMPAAMRLSKIGMMTMAESSSILSTVLRGFNLGAGHTNHIVDVLALAMHRSKLTVADLDSALSFAAAQARNAGWSFDETTASLELLGRFGVPASRAGTGLQRVIQSLVNPTKAGNEALAAMGLTVKDLQDPKKGLLPLSVILEKLTGGLSKLNKPSQSAVIDTIFGKRGGPIMQDLLTGGTAALEKLTQENKRAGGESERMVSKIMDNMKGSVSRFTASVKNAGITLLEKFQPALKSVFDYATREAPKAEKALTDFLSGIAGGKPKKTIVKSHHLGPVPLPYTGPKLPRAVLALPLSTGQYHATGIVPHEASASEHAGEIIKNVISKGGPIAAHVVVTIASAVTRLVKAFAPLAPLLKGIGEGVIGGIVGAFNVLIPVINGLSTGIAWVLGLLKPFGVDMETVGKIVGFIFGGEFLDGIRIVGKLGESFPLLGKAFGLVGKAASIAKIPIGLLKGMLGFLWDGMKFGGKTVVWFVDHLQGLNRWLHETGGAFAGLLGKISNFAIGAIGKLESIAKDGAKWVVDLATSIGKKVGEVFPTVAKWGESIGSAIIKGIVSIIKKAPGQLVAAINGIIPSPIKKAAGSLLGLVEEGAKAVSKGTKKLLSKHAAGGIVKTPLQLVGERGPELAALPLGTRILPAPATAQFLHQRPAPVMVAAPAARPIEIRFQPTMDGRVIHDSVHRVEQTQLEAA